MCLCLCCVSVLCVCVVCLCCVSVLCVCQDQTSSRIFRMQMLNWSCSWTETVGRWVGCEEVFGSRRRAPGQKPGVRRCLGPGGECPVRNLVWGGVWVQEASARSETWCEEVLSCRSSPGSCGGGPTWGSGTSQGQRSAGCLSTCLCSLGSSCSGSQRTPSRSCRLRSVRIKDTKVSGGLRLFCLYVWDAPRPPGFFKGSVCNIYCPLLVEVQITVKLIVLVAAADKRWNQTVVCALRQTHRVEGIERQLQPSVQSSSRARTLWKPGETRTCGKLQPVGAAVWGETETERHRETQRVRHRETQRDRHRGTERQRGDRSSSSVVKWNKSTDSLL